VPDAFHRSARLSTALVAGACLLGACLTDRVATTADGRAIRTVRCDNFHDDFSRCFALAHATCPDAYDVIERSPDRQTRWLQEQDHGLGETVEPSPEQYLRIACKAR
jgi:hypothetical protein